MCLLLILVHLPLNDINFSFENSTSILNCWVTWCQSGCGNRNAGQLSTTSCYSSNCYKDHCQFVYDYLGQSFSSTIGISYIISFWLYQTACCAINCIVETGKTKTLSLIKNILSINLFDCTY
jgi:hypothetical protein